MEKKYFLIQFFAGLFFVASICLIVFVVFTIGSERGLTEPKFEMSVLYREIGGLSTGSPVTLSGVHVGTVGEINFLEKEVAGRGVKVTLSLFERYKKQLRKATEITIITEGILGEKIIEISTHPKMYRNDLTKAIIGQDPLDVEDLAQTFGAAAESLLETSKTLDTVTIELLKMSSSVRRLLNRIEQRVIDGNLFKVF